MAQGDVTKFDQFGEDEALALHQLETAVIKLALITDAVTPTAADADPRFGAGGTTNYLTNEATPGGNYATGGIDCAGTISRAGGTTTFDCVTNPQWLQNAGNPTNARWGILYNETSANRAIAFVDLGSTFDMTTGDLTVTWNASGVMIKT